MSKNLDLTYAPSPVEEKTIYETLRGERLQGTAEGRSRLLRLANSSAASFSGRNEFPRTHFSLIIK